MLMINSFGKKCEVYEQNYPQALPAIYQVISSICYSLTFLIIKLITTMPGQQILFIRSIITIVFNGLFADLMNLEQYPRSKSTLNKLIIRGLFGGFGGLSFFVGIKLLPLSEGIVLFRTNPIWTALIAILYLRTEKLNASVFTNIALCMIGVIFIAKPPFFIELWNHFQFMKTNEQTHQSNYEYHSLGVFLCLFTSFAITAVQLTIKSLQGEVSQFVILQYFSIFTIIIPAFASLYFSVDSIQFPNLEEIFLLLIISILGWIAQITMNRSFLIGNLTKMALWGQSQIIFSFILDILILNDKLDFLSVSGTLLILLSLTLSILKKGKK